MTQLMRVPVILLVAMAVASVVLHVVTRPAAPTSAVVGAGQGESTPTREDAAAQSGDKEVIRGTVVDLNGQGIAGVRVSVLDASEQSVAQVTTEKDGTFVIEAVLPQPLTLQVAGDRAETAVLTLPRERPEQIEIWTGRLVSVGGNVVNHAAYPIEKVLARQGAREFETAVIAGQFSFDRLPLGSYWIWGEGSGAATAAVLVNVGENTDVSLTAAAGHIIRGQVIDDESKGVKATVLASSESGFVRSVETDAAGSFQFAPVAAGALQFIAYADGYAGSDAAKVPVPTAGPLILTVRRGTVVVGTVVDEDGVPVLGANVTAKASAAGEKVSGVKTLSIGELGVTAGPVPPIAMGMRDNTFFAQPQTDKAAQKAPLVFVGANVTTATTDVTGRFELPGQRAGTLRISASHPDYATANVNGIAGNEAVSKLAPIVLRRGVALNIVVLDQGENPLAGAAIRVAGQAMRTDDNGRLNAGRFAGIVTIEASHPGHANEEKRVPLSGSEQQVTFTLLRADARLQGQVLSPQDLPLAGARVTIAKPKREAIADANGDFVFDNLLPGKYEVTASFSGYLPKSLRGTTDDELAVRLAYGAEVQCLVIQSENDLPLLGAKVTAVVDAKKISKTVGADGRIVLRSLPPGNIIVEASAPGYANAKQTLLVPAVDGPGVRVRGCRLSLARTATIRGSVRFKGQRVGGAKVVSGAQSVTTNAYGEFTLDIAPGKQTIRATHQGLKGTAEVNLGPGENQSSVDIEISD